MAFTFTRKFAASLTLLAALPAVTALVLPVQRAELARAVGLNAECPAGYHWEKEGSFAECARPHPEGFLEMRAAIGQRLSSVTAPFTSVAAGAYRLALEEKEALYNNQPLVAGSAGEWHEYGTGPLIVDDPRYGSVNGEGLADVSGRIDSFDYDAANNRLFASLGTGGIWMSTDKGAHWVSVSNTLPSQIVGSVAWTSAGGGTLVVAGGDPNMGGDDYAGLGAFWSNDLGVSWHQASGVPDGALGFKVAVDHSSPNIVYLGLSKGLYRSTDAGRSFTNVNLPSGCINLADHKCDLANFVTDVIVKEPGGLASPASAGPLAAVPNGTVLAAIGYRAGTGKKYPDGTQHSPGNGLYTSPTGARDTFTKLNPTAVQTGSPVGFAVPSRIGRVAFGPAIGPAQDHNYVYAMVEDAVLFNCGFATIDLPEQIEAQVEPNNATCGLAPGTLFNGLYVSPDFGKTWVQLADTNEIAVNPATGTALMGLQGLGYQPGVQGYYNLWVHPDPTRADPALGVPTRLVFGLEEVWTNRVPAPLNGLAQAGPDDFKVVGKYFGGVCGGLNLGLPYCPLNGDPTVAETTTTHPDQHAGIFIPDTDGSGGVTLVVGNDGGAFSQHTTSSGDVSQGNWGRGSNLGFYTLLPYNIAVAKDGKVWQGWQDNGSGYIDPVSRKQYMTYGGDGFFAAVDPDHSNIAYTEYTYGDIRVTQNGGNTWSGIAPSGSGAPPYNFSTPFFMDPTDAKHLITGGSTVYERTNGPSGSWTSVYNLGTASSGATNSVSAVTLQGAAAYVGFCGVCDILNHTDQGFRNGLATNVSATGALPTAKASSAGWHKATLSGLPNRYINGIAIDPDNVRTVYVVLGGYANRGWVPVGTVGDTNPNPGLDMGHVFKSTDAGEHFTDISGDLPDAHATSIILRGQQIIVGTDIGAFISNDASGTTWAPVGGNLPAAPVLGLQIQPGTTDHLFAATFGRGVWDYHFVDATPVNTAPVATLTSDVASGDTPLAVTFTVAGTDADNDTLSYDLDFDDGSTHSTVAGAVPHTYTAVGDHTASLTVSDGKGGTSTKTLLIHVTQPAPVNHAPVATLSPPTATIHENEAVSFTVGATDEDGDALTVDLDFDDHSTHGTQTGVVGHTYTTAGSYTATLTVSDGRGGVATKTTSVTVQPATVGSLAVHLAADKSGGDVSHGAITVTFTASVENDDGTPLQYTFAFGDGETSTFTQASNVITHDYAYAGTYHPYVTATQEYGSRAATSGENEATITTTTSVAVDPVLAAKLLYDFPNGNVAPADVVFSTDGSSGESYTLEFGDGDKTEGTGAPPASITHHYAAPQAYTAKLTVRNSSGSASDSNSQTFTLVAKQQLTALLQVSASEGTSPLEVIIDGCHSIPGNGHRLASFTVNFGDGTDPVTQAVDSAHVVDCSATDRSSDPSVFTHTYTVTSTKSFFPTLTVTDDVAASSFATYSTGVAVAAPAVAAPAASGGGGGGGFGWLTLIPMFGAAIFRRRRFA